MPRSFFQYWKYSQALYEIGLEEAVQHSGSSQLKRVEPGDTVWLVTVSPEGALFLVGRILVSQVMTHLDAVKRFGEDIYTSPLHIAAREGTEEMPRFVSLMDIARELRFASSSNQKLRFSEGRVNPQQLQTMRLLTVESARLVEQCWGAGELPGTSELEAQISQGAGFGSPERNKEVERAAVSFVTKHYESEGWNVRSVEADRCGYDLVCTKGALREDVEVKGVSGSRPAFIITRGEVQQAGQNPNFVLFVVTSALTPDRCLWRHNGQEFLERFQLEELAFRAIQRD